jgi:hypothetical protein
LRDEWCVLFGRRRRSGRDQGVGRGGLIISRAILSNIASTACPALRVTSDSMRLVMTSRVVRSTQFRTALTIAVAASMPKQLRSHRLRVGTPVGKTRSHRLRVGTPVGKTTVTPSSRRHTCRQNYGHTVSAAQRVRIGHPVSTHRIHIDCIFENPSCVVSWMAMIGEEVETRRCTQTCLSQRAVQTVSGVQSHRANAE